MDCQKDSWLPDVAVEGPEGSCSADGEAAASFLSLQMSAKVKREGSIDCQEGRKKRTPLKLYLDKNTFTAGSKH